MSTDQNLKETRILSYLTFLLLVFSVVAYFIQAYIYLQQLRTLKDQEIQQLRAYVGSTSAYIIGFIPPTTIVLKNEFKNFGTTPAYSFTFSHSQEFSVEQPNNVFKIGAGNQLTPAHVTLFPSQDQSWRDYAAADPQQISSFNKGQTVILYYGMMLYTDVFKIRREQSFCYYFQKSDLDVFLKSGSKAAGQKCNNNDVVKSDPKSDE